MDIPVAAHSLFNEDMNNQLVRSTEANDDQTLPLTLDLSAQPLTNSPSWLVMPDSKRSNEHQARALPGISPRRRNQHSDLPRPFECLVCGKRFLLAHHLSSHAHTHTGDRPYPCQQCGSRFTQISSLRRHCYTIHHACRGERVGKTSSCKSVSTARPTAHTRKTSAPIRPACNTCCKTFKTMFTLRRHMPICPGVNLLHDFSDILNPSSSVSRTWDHGMDGVNGPGSPDFDAERRRKGRKAGQPCVSETLRDNSCGNGLEAKQMVFKQSTSDVTQDNGSRADGALFENDLHGSSLVSDDHHRSSTCDQERDESARSESDARSPGNNDDIDYSELDSFVESIGRRGNRLNNALNDSPAESARLESIQCTPDEFGIVAARPYRCLECNHTFRLPHHLTNHVATHSGARPFTCFSCGHHFSQISSLKRHVANHCPATMGPRHHTKRCQACDKKFVNARALKGHMMTEHFEVPAGLRWDPSSNF